MWNEYHCLVVGPFFGTAFLWDWNLAFPVLWLLLSSKFADISSAARFPSSSAGKESACNSGDPGSTPGLGRSAEEGIGYPFQYSLASLVAQLLGIHLQYRRAAFNPWVGKIPWKRERQTTPVFSPGELHGLYSPESQGVGHDWATLAFFQPVCVVTIIV